MNMSKTAARAALGLLFCLLLTPSMLAFADEGTAAATTAPKAGSVQITDVTQLDPYFPDPLFKQAVFNAVKDGADGAVGTDVEDALNNFLGVVEYNKSNVTPADQKIKDVHGIEYLRNAELVSLKYNEIKDFSWLGKERIKEADDPKYLDNKRYFGQVRNIAPDLDEDAKNVTWDFAGNPIAKLPDYFGGQLKILQPGGSSYTYSEDLSDSYLYVRPEGASAVSGSLDIHKTSIYSKDGLTMIRPVEIEESKISPRPGDIATKMTIDTFTATTANFSNLEKSGVFHVYTGTKAELQYGTNDDHAGITDGAQSFKYYITPSFRIYDRITATSAVGGTAQLIKTDTDGGSAVKDATYNVYSQDGALVQEGLITDADGKATTQNLLPGSYYFQEMKAPSGYLLNADKVPFTIVENTTAAGIPATTVGGGEQTVTTSDGTTVTAGANERLFAGGREKADGTGDLMSPDITLTSTGKVVGVQVTYSKLDNGTVSDNVVRTFKTLAEAEADINTEKANNTIIGPVSVKASYDAATGTNPVTVATADKKIPTIDIPVTKNWQDNSNWAGPRKNIDIFLWIEGQATPVDTWHLQGTNTAFGGGQDSFTHTFQNLPATDEHGTPLKYEVTEGPVEDSYGNFDKYITSIDSDPNNPSGGFTVANTYNNEAKFLVTGQKTWSGDDAANRPDSISFTLTQTNASGHDPYVLKTTATAANNWQYEFKNIPLWEVKDSVRATYTLSETPVSGYTPFTPIEGIQGTTDTATTQIDPALTTNTYKTVDMSGVKTWGDYNNVFNTRPAEITVNLLRDGTVIDSAKVTADNGWAYSFSGLPELNNKGAAYVYTVEEQAVPADYTATVDGSNITNTLDPQKNKTVKVEGTKTWVDHADWAGKNDHPVITINLLANGEKVADTKLATGTASEGTYSFENLAKYDNDGKEITYTVSEEQVEAVDGGGYVATIDGYDITNTWYANELVNLNVSKQWVDGENAQNTRPDAISVTLTRDGTAFGETTLSTDNSWSYTFTDLPKYQETDKGSSTELSVYTLEEKAVDGYTATYGAIDFTGVFHGDSANTTITNTLDAQAEETVVIAGTKTWSDNNDAAKKRPAKITVALLSNGVEKTTKNVTEADGWKYEFTDLPKLDANDKEIVYTVDEKDVDAAYTATVDGYDITNTLKPTPLPKDPNDNPKGSQVKKLVGTGDATGTGAMALIALAALGTVVVAARKRKKN